jgi:serine/threonine-protein kinase HipA
MSTEMNPNREASRSAVKKPSVLEVWLNDVRVGTITNLPYDRNLFVFEESYAADRNRPTLSLSFSDPQGNLIVSPQEVTARVPAFFSNLLPEGRLREYLAERGGVNQVREFFLLWLLGADLPGAVRVQDAEGRSLPPVEDSSANARKPVQRSEEVLRFSLAGVQLKFSAVGQPGKQLAIPVEGRGGHWIVKLPSPRYPLIPENEYSMMKLAAEVGIEIAEVGLIPTKDIENLPGEFVNDNSNSLYVKRFDRTREDKRIHIEDFNQVYAQFPEAKYKRFSYGNMAGDIWRVLGQSGLTEFIRRLIFNAAIGNADMHLKNWSLIYPDSKNPQLAPAYDFVSTIRYIEDPTMALSVAKEKDTKFLDDDHLKRFAAKAQIPSQIVLDTALETAEKFIGIWRRMAPELPLDTQMRERINERIKYIPLTRKLLYGGSGPGQSPQHPSAGADTTKGT